MIFWQSFQDFANDSLDRHRPSLRCR